MSVLRKLSVAYIAARVLRALRWDNSNLLQGSSLFFNTMACFWPVVECYEIKETADIPIDKNTFNAFVLSEIRTSGEAPFALRGRQPSVLIDPSSGFAFWPTGKNMKLYGCRAHWKLGRPLQNDRTCASLAVRCHVFCKEEEAAGSVIYIIFFDFDIL